MLAIANNVVPSPTDNAEVIHSAVFEEFAVFNGQDGVNQVGWNRIVGQQPTLRPIRVFAQSGDQLGFQLVACEGLPTLVDDGVDLACARVDGGDVRRVVRLRSWLN